MIILKLILAHLIGDFFLQPNSWVASKERDKLKSPYLYLHVFIHFCLMNLLLMDASLWSIAAIVAVTHFIIDVSKLYFQTIKTKRAWFFVDQFLHFAVIAIIGLWLGEINLNLLSDTAVLKYSVAALFLTLPSSYIIRNLLASWTPFSQNQNDIQTDSLTNAGKYIGILERLLVFVFIAVNHWEGVGFMIAAKSVFRFSDLAQAKQRKLTEYVLVGTLLSFGLAIITGILINL